MATHVFLSYAREDAAIVRRLRDALDAHGISSWLDSEDLRPGDRWQGRIRDAIRRGAFFLACFSTTSVRKRSYMNEELTLAIEELRLRPIEQAWFIPVLLDECDVPDRPIGAGETLRSLQWVKLFEDWDRGVDRLVATIDPDMAHLHGLMRGLADPSARARIRAIDGLGALGSAARAAVPALTSALRDTNETVRAAAADALGKIGEANERLIAALVQTAQTGDFYERKHAHEALAALGAPAIPALLAYAPDSIASVSDPLAVKPLMDALRGGKLDAATALGNLGAAATPAVALLIATPGPEAAKALGRIGDRSAIPELARRSKLDGWEGVYAIEGLGRLGGRDASQALLAAVVANLDGSTAFEYAVNGVVSIGDADAIETLIPILLRRLGQKVPSPANEGSNSVLARAAAAKALGKIGRAAFVPGLADALGETWTVFKEAAEALCCIGTPEAKAAVIPELTKRLRTGTPGDYFERLTAVRLFGQLGDSTFAPALREFLEDPSVIVREQAAKSLRLLEHHDD